MCVGSKSALNSIAPHPKETISLQNNLLKNLEINLEINNHNLLITHDQHQSFVLLWAASVLSRFWSIFHKGRGGVYLYLLFSLELHMKQIKSRFEARSALQVVIHKRAKQFHAFDDIFSACFIPQLCNSRFLNCFFYPLGTVFQTCEIEEASFLVCSTFRVQTSRKSSHDDWKVQKSWGCRRSSSDHKGASYNNDTSLMLWERLLQKRIEGVVLAATLTLLCLL